MLYADFMAFLFPQHELMRKEGRLEISPDILLDVCHATSVPPYIRKMGDIVREHTWFLGLVGKPTRPSCFYGLQNPPEDVDVLDLHLLKLLSIYFTTLAYESANEYGGGFATPDEPLTDRGREFIDDLAKVGIILDLSHIGHRTARDVIEHISNQKRKTCVVATHTACHSLYDHGRNLPDDVLVGIRDLGGLVGLVTMTWMLHPTDNSLQPFLDHLNHLKQLIGVSNICLGTDGTYQHLDPEEERTRFEIMKAKIDPRGNFRARYPLEAVELNRPDKLMVIEQYLKSSDWTETEIQKVMGENLTKFFSKL